MPGLEGCKFKKSSQEDLPEDIRRELNGGEKWSGQMLVCACRPRDLVAGGNQKEGGRQGQRGRQGPGM